MFATEPEPDEALRMVLEHDVATRQDLWELEARLEARMAEMETRLLVRLAAIMVGGVTILGVLMGLLLALGKG